jgi:hypothetical protein
MTSMALPLHNLLTVEGIIPRFPIKTPGLMMNRLPVRAVLHEAVKSK